MRTILAIVAFALCLPMVNAQNPAVTWDSQSLIINGHRVTPVMGEIHYSRLPEAEWPSAVRKMREGGVTIIATYIFWNHIEESENQFDWSGQRNLRHFLEVCKAESMPVVLRLGPFCHGEARNGGIPDWVFSKTVKVPTDSIPRKIKVRTEDPIFLQLVERLYRQIFTQVQGLQWKDGGPVMAAQFDNEYRGHGSYLMALKSIATDIGFDLPFYTRTGWPELRTPVPFGEMLPLYGDYADGFWEKSTEERAGNYWKAFHFKAFRSSTAIGTDLLGKQEEKTSKGDNDYPYFTCELGGGMVTAYHRRPFIYATDALALATVKLGSGSNLLGYYMYHGGTNPEGHLTTLNETQRTIATANNDLPVKSYEFQAPLGEFGQHSESYYLLRPLHIFLQDYGEELAPMESHFPYSSDEESKGTDNVLRWCWRSSSDGKSGFVFVSNYDRLHPLTDKQGIQFSVGSTTFPSKPITIPSGTVCIFPYGIDGIDYATAQLVARRDNKIYLMQVDGVRTDICVGGKLMRNVKPRGTERPVCKNIYLIDQATAQRMEIGRLGDWSFGRLGDWETGRLGDWSFGRLGDAIEVDYHKVQEGTPRETIPIGPAKVAEAPTDEDFKHAAQYRIDLPEGSHNMLLDIDYHGDCARLYADGILIDDNFYNGRHFQYGLWRLPEGTRTLTLSIMPLQSGMPIYLPREADSSPGESINKITLIQP